MDFSLSDANYFKSMISGLLVSKNRSLIIRPAKKPEPGSIVWALPNPSGLTNLLYEISKGDLVTVAGPWSSGDLVTARIAAASQAKVFKPGWTPEEPFDLVQGLSEVGVIGAKPATQSLGTSITVGHRQWDLSSATFLTISPGRRGPLDANSGSDYSQLQYLTSTWILPSGQPEVMLEKLRVFALRPLQTSGLTYSFELDLLRDDDCLICTFSQLRALGGWAYGSSWRAYALGGLRSSLDTTQETISGASLDLEAGVLKNFGLLRINSYLVQVLGISSSDEARFQAGLESRIGRGWEGFLAARYRVDGITDPEFGWELGLTKAW